MIKRWITRFCRTSPTSLKTDPIHFADLFGNANPVEVEIGCGKGLFLANRAGANPGINFFGIDRAGKWMRKGVRKAERRKLANVRFLKGIADQIFPDLLPSGQVSVFHIYFPDPWPKRRHHRRRLLSPSFLSLLHEKLKGDGLIEIATDDADYFAAIRKAVAETGPLWRTMRESLNRRLFDEPCKTNYELKFQAAGKEILYLELEK